VHRNNVEKEVRGGGEQVGGLWHKLREDAKRIKGRRSGLCRAVADKSVWKHIELVREIELVVF
jgi:hypothetical protein